MYKFLFCFQGLNQSWSKYNTLYKVECRNCELKFIGQSSRRLQYTMVWHASDIILLKKNYAITEHSIELWQRANFENGAVFCQENFFRDGFH